MLNFLRLILGLAVGIASGYFIGKYWGYYSLNQKNTAGSFDNPELNELEEVQNRGKMGVGDKIVLLFFILFAYCFGGFFIFTGLVMTGIVDSDILNYMSVNGSAGTMFCVGGFALALGTLMLVGLLTGNVKKG